MSGIWGAYFWEGFFGGAYYQNFMVIWDCFRFWVHSGSKVGCEEGRSWGRSGSEKLFRVDWKVFSALQTLFSVIKYNVAYISWLSLEKVQ